MKHSAQEVGPLPHFDYVRCLDSTPLSIELVGGKAASLTQLRALDAPVPPAFAVTTDAYRLHVDRLDVPLRASLAKNSDLAEIRERIIAEPLPEHVASAIVSEIETLRVEGSLAVRSSATTEDSPTFSFAGLHDTSLAVDCRADAVEAAIKACWASLWSERSVEYRRRGGASLDSAAMAVVVQQLVHADISFVAFSADPMRQCARRTIISASYGLGEAIVAGLVVPDYIVVGPDGKVEDYQIGSKETMVITAPAGGVRRAAVPRMLAGQPALRDEQAQEIARMVTRLEDRFGMPLDIEGGVTNGSIHLFQARPITTCFATM